MKEATIGTWKVIDKHRVEIKWKSEDDDDPETEPIYMQFNDCGDEAYQV